MIINREQYVILVQQDTGQEEVDLQELYVEEGRSIKVGDKITITVMSINNGRIGVNIGIDAPKDLVILREEVLLRSQDSE